MKPKGNKHDSTKKVVWRYQRCFWCSLFSACVALITAACDTLKNSAFMVGYTATWAALSGAVVVKDALGIPQYKIEADPEQYFDVNNLGEIEMARAINAGKASKVKSLLKEGKTTIDHQGKLGFHYINYAVYLQQEAVVKVLLELGADPDQLSVVALGKSKKETTLTPLYTACWYYAKGSMLSLLLDHGASMYDERVYSPFLRAVENFMESPSQAMAFFEHGIEVNRLFKGVNPINAAVRGRTPILAEFLLDIGADPFLGSNRNEKLQSDLQHALETSTPEIVEDLKKFQQRVALMTEANQPSQTEKQRSLENFKIKVAKVYKDRLDTPL